MSLQLQSAIQDNLAATPRVDTYYDTAPGLAEHPANHPERRCYLAWSECFVCADGKVAPCCIDLDETTVGNLYDEDFWAIWNGPRMVDWRRTVNREPHGICQFGTCIFRNGVPQSATA